MTYNPNSAGDPPPYVEWVWRDPYTWPPQPYWPQPYQPWTPPAQTGWICPICSRANAPWVQQCGCRSAVTYGETGCDILLDSDPFASGTK